MYNKDFIEFKAKDLIEYKIKGKWLIFFNNFEFADKLCKELIEKGVILEANHSVGGTYGVCRFFVESKDLKQHKKLLRYLIDNDYIPRTKKENYLYNVAFKLQLQSDRGEYYETGFRNLLNLSDLVDLESGDFLEVNETVFDRIDKYLKEGCGYHGKN